MRIAPKNNTGSSYIYLKINSTKKRGGISTLIFIHDRPSVENGKPRFSNSPPDTAVRSHSAWYSAGVTNEYGPEWGFTPGAMRVRDDDDDDMSTGIYLSTYASTLHPTSPHPLDAAGLRATCGNESDR